jgi:hypothetical protein
MTTPGLVRTQAQPTVALAVQQQQAQDFRNAEALFAAQAVADILALWGTLNLRDILVSWPAIRVALAALIRERFMLSVAAAEVYYRQARLAAGVTASFSFPAVPPPDEELIRVTLDSTGPYGLLGRLKAAQPLPLADRNTGVILSGAASRLIQNGARQAVLRAVGADDKAVAWMRVTAANPCAFCSMLAGRGATYKTAQSAGFKAHNACRCVAAPVFSWADARASKNNPLRRQWDQVTLGLSGKDAIRAWRRYWESQNPGVLGSEGFAA